MKFFELIPQNTNFNFIGKFPWFVAFSFFTLAIVITGWFTKGFNYGIDFTGGSVVHVSFHEATPADVVRKLVEQAGSPDASVVAMGQDSHEYLITAPADLTEKKDTLDRRLIAKAGADKLKILQVDHVGPKVGAELKRAAAESLIYSILLITIYIWFRFDFRFAPGATTAMLHDIVIVSGFYLFTGREFTITAVAALLTIAGYSVNDTIVVYDRVREILKSGGDTLPLDQTINRAINLTLSRTLLTSGVTLISILPVIFFCKGEIRDFAEAMAVGIFVGTYSTIYIAAPATIYVERFMAKKGTRNRTVAA